MQPRLLRSTADRIVDLVLSHMDESLRLIASQAIDAFESLCSILVKQQAVLGASDATPTAEDLRDTLLALDVQSQSKTRYALLASLLPHIAVNGLMEARPFIIREALAALPSSACVAASAFLRRLLLALRQQCTSDDACGSAVERWRACWTCECFDALRSGDARTIGSVATYFLKYVLTDDPDSLPVLLRGLVCPGTAEDHEGAAAGLSSSAAAIVAVLRMARRLQIVSTLDEVVAGRGASETVPECTLRVAALNIDPVLRFDVFELAAISSRSASVRVPLRAAVVVRQPMNPTCLEGALNIRRCRRRWSWTSLSRCSFWERGRTRKLITTAGSVSRARCWSACAQL